MSHHAAAAATQPGGGRGAPGGGSAPDQAGRLRALDGLRGIASLGVVTYHLLLAVPAVTAVVVAGAAPRAGSPEWWLYKTPLRLFLAGHEAVLVFFVLSGIVLTLPLLSGPDGRPPWRSYYPRRLLRLYLPVWGALLLASCVIVAVLPAHAVSTGGQAFARPTGARLARDSVLLFGTSNIDSPLWSLRWEMWFSLLLPVMFGALVVLRVTRWWLAAFALLAAASIASRFTAVATALPVSFLTSGLLQYLPVFAMGMILALQRHRLAALAARVESSPHSVVRWRVAVVAAVLLILAPSFVASHTKPFGAVNAIGYALSLTGVCLLLCITLARGSASRFLRSRPVRWAGSRSFSIYLVHAPIVVAVAQRTDLDDHYLPWLAVSVLVLAAVLVVAELFYRLVERPAHRLSRQVGELAGGRRAAAATPAAGIRAAEVAAATAPPPSA